MALISVDQDQDNVGGGAITASQHTVFINNKAVSVVGDNASSDSKFPSLHGLHGDPTTASGSPNVFVTNKAVHREGDTRACGDTTVVSGQATVFANS